MGASFKVLLRDEERRLRHELQASSAYQRLDAVERLIRLYSGSLPEENSSLAILARRQELDAAGEEPGAPGDFLSAVRAERAGLVRELRASPISRRLEAVMLTAEVYAEASDTAPAAPPEYAPPAFAAPTPPMVVARAPAAAEVASAPPGRDGASEAGDPDAAVAKLRASLNRADPSPEGARLSSVGSALFSAAFGRAAADKA